MKAKLLSPGFTYRSAEESRKPGYLARRFAAIRREQKEAQVEVETKVTQLKVKSK